MSLSQKDNNQANCNSNRLDTSPPLRTPLLPPPTPWLGGKAAGGRRWGEAGMLRGGKPLQSGACGTPDLHQGAGPSEDLAFCDYTRFCHFDFGTTK